MSMTRRTFIQQTGAISAASVTSLNVARAANGANEKIVIGVMGVNGRGAGLARAFASMPGSTVAYICDVDDRAAERTAKSLTDREAPAPKTVRDFRKILDDKSVDALVIAAPDHWHGPATILACAAGKHVYVEKPVSHNPREGELMVEASRKYRKVVQAGTQRRSTPSIIEAIDRLHNGDIGRVLFARGWYNNSRPSIGNGKSAPVPDWLDYALWQGPAPDREYRDNIVHYNWHWFWHWGTGELGNNGIHALDVCRWGLKVDYPLRITSGGGKYFYNDDQETPDTHTVTYDFGDKGITWEGRNWHRRGFEGSMFGIAFYGDQGTMIIDGGKYLILDPQGKEVTQANGSSDDRQHLQNFLDCIRNGKRPNADIEDGHKSTLLCHLGNIAYRVGRTINLDSKTYKIVGDAEAHRLWTREYRSGWEPRV